MENNRINDQILRLNDVKQLAGNISRTTIWRMERDGNFPKRVSIGARAVGWRQSEIMRWIETRTPVN